MFGRSFFLGWLSWLGGKRPPVPGRCIGLRTAPARIRGGTQGIAEPNGCGSEPQWLGMSFGAGPRQVFVRTAAWKIICIARAEPFSGYPPRGRYAISQGWWADS